MGLYNSITKQSERSAVKHYDTHNTITDQVLDASADGITTSSDIEWKVSSVPTTIRTPETATQEQAEKEELEAVEHANAVQFGIRVLKARTKKIQETAKLVGHQRKHLSSVAKATFSMAASNVGLAKTVQGLRAGYAQLGHGLDDTTQRMDHAVAKIKAKYNQGR